MASATLRDESPLGERFNDIELSDLPDQISARELVRLRVREEVARYNLDPRGPYRGLVTPTAAERELNEDASRAGRRRVDWERQADLAEQAFEHQRFVLIIGDRQVESLDENVDLTGGQCEIVFIKLVPLAGG